MLNLLAPEELAELDSLLSNGKFGDEAVQLARALDALENYSSRYPIECYEPIKQTRDGGPHQLQFHLATTEGRGAYGGNQSGKTQSGAVEAAIRFQNIYPHWLPKELRSPRYNVGRIVVKDFPHAVTEVIEPALRKLIPKHLIADERTNNKGYLVKLISKTGAHFDIVTWDMDTTAFEGWQGDWAWFDEPPPRDKWVATLRGLIRRKGRWWITCTPLSEPWMYDEIFTNPDHFCINIDMRDNPYLSEEAIRNFESKLTEEEREARIHGRFMHLSGLTYKEFDAKIHVKPRTTDILLDWPRWLICDPHSRRPFALTWIAVDPMGRVWIYDEWPMGMFHEIHSSNKSLKDYIHIIREKEMGQQVHRRIIDGRAGKSPLLSGTSERQDTLIDAFDDLGLHFEPSYITMTTGVTDPGHLKLKDFLRVTPVTDEPSLYVLENCRNTIYAFQHNCWETHRREDGTVSEQQAQFAKDYLDNIRYFLMDDPKWIDPSEMQEEKQTPAHWDAMRDSANQVGFGHV